MSDIIPVHIYILTTRNKKMVEKKKIKNLIIIHKQRLSKAVASQNLSLCGNPFDLPSGPRPPS
jgi:hypothetical protein